VTDVLEGSVETRVKPGNPIHVRVIDPDRSRTAEVDELVVSVATSSGDAIGRIVLEETDTHSGRFEGSIPTANAQAMAFARNSEPGRNPNMVISPSPGYPAWRPTPIKDVAPAFRVDLNDNVELGRLTMTAREVGAKLKKFALRTGLNPRDMNTIAVYPNDQISVERPWAPSVVIMNDTDHHHTRNDRSVYDLSELTEHVERGWMKQKYPAGVAENIAGPSQALTPTIPARVKWKRNNHHHNAHVIYRFRGYFYEPDAVTRRFRVHLGPYTVPEKTHPSVAHPPQFLLAVNGRPITDKEKPDRLEGEVNLRPGLHRFEIWATGWDCTIGFGRDITLTANLNDPAEMSDCPDHFFDPTTFPKGLLAHRNAPATIGANESGTEFSVAFAPGSRARLLELVFIEQEGPVPALNKLALTTPDGETVLPVAEDFASLNKNNTLEMLVGDKVTVRYTDDRVVTKAKENLERFLNVAYSDARVAFEFFEMRPRRGGEELEPYYEKRFRFEHGKPVYLTVNDPDMDVSVKPDTVEITVESESGGPQRFKATESGDSTGIFRLRLTPVTGTPDSDGEVQVAEGEALTAMYRDRENLRPGVPTDRFDTIDHAAFSRPVLRLSHATVSPIDPKEWPSPRGLHPGFTPLSEHDFRTMSRSEEKAVRDLYGSQGSVRARWHIDTSRQAL
ncbi:MAG: hypothetical protein AAF492_13150, partial [Verrucomicrobiota bacterium]